MSEKTSQVFFFLSLLRAMVSEWLWHGSKQMRGFATFTDEHG